MKRYPNRTYLTFLFIVFGVLLSFYSLTCAIGSDSPLLVSDWDKDIPCEWSGVKRIVAVGDLHGAYDNFVVILKDTGLVDDNLNWIGGETHLVQIGDILDRGDKPKEIFNLAMRLEKEAEAAGGKVHILIGNHEEMNLANTAFDREGYITPAQFRDFLPEKYILKQENKFRKRSGSKSSDSDGDYNKNWKEIIDKFMGDPRSTGRMTYMRTLNILYGDWIIGNNVIIKINDIVFVHGGISENFSHWPLKDINETYRRELDDIRTAVVRNQQPKIPVYDRELFNREDGPLWYRAMAGEESEEFRDDVERILTNLQANHVVIAHTPHTRQGIEEMRKYGGKVWVIDTGIADYYKPIGGHLSALIIENGKFFVSYPDSEQKNLVHKFK